MDVAELTARKADVVSGINSASQQLRDALFDGKPTGEIRAFLAQLRERLAVIERGLGIAQAAQQAAEARRVEDMGRSLAADVAHRLKIKLEALQPPPAPVPAKAD
jgi:hypothetical protein